MSSHDCTALQILHALQGRLFQTVAVAADLCALAPPSLLLLEFLLARPHTAPAFSLLITPPPTGYRLCSSLPPRTLPVRASASLRLKLSPILPNQSLLRARGGVQGAHLAHRWCARLITLTSRGIPTSYGVVRNCCGSPALLWNNCNASTRREVSSAPSRQDIHRLCHKLPIVPSLLEILGSHASLRVSQQRTFVIHPILPLPQNRHMNSARWKLDRRYATH